MGEETQLGHFHEWGSSRWRKQGLDVGGQWVPCGDTGVFCCECNATDWEQLLDFVMSHTGFVSSCPGAFCNGNDLVKSYA